MAHDLAAFKQYFIRDFVFGNTQDKVMDSDIEKALHQVPIVFNSGIWATPEELDIAYLFLAAHYMVLDIQNAGGLNAINLSQGINSRGNAAINQTNVGSVSVKYAISAFVKDNPVLSGLLQTGYGVRYLEFLTPYLIGNVGIVSGPIQYY